LKDVTTSKIIMQKRFVLQANLLLVINVDFFALNYELTTHVKHSKTYSFCIHKEEQKWQNVIKSDH
jgi:hypothetical protein